MLMIRENSCLFTDFGPLKKLSVNKSDLKPTYIITFRSKYIRGLKQNMKICLQSQIRAHLNEVTIVNVLLVPLTDLAECSGCVLRARVSICCVQCVRCGGGCSEMVTMAHGPAVSVYKTKQMSNQL